MSITWPNGKRIAVSLGFDLDAETTWTDGIRCDREHITNMSRGTYGAKQGAPRILDMLDRLGVKATFFVPAINAEKYPALISEISRRGHELGYHGYRHCEDPSVTMETEDAAMTKCEKIFFDLTGQKLCGHRAPGGMFYDFNPELFKKHGYIYSSNYSHRDAPYLLERDGEKLPIVELGCEAFFDDSSYDMYTNSPPERYGLKTGRQLARIWQDEFDAMSQENGKAIALTMHPQFIGRVSRLNALFGLVSHMKANGAWLATNKEIAEHVLKSEGFLPQ